ncbi:MAG: TniQ family protein [Dissulfurispiraceae bacterium]
MSLLAYKIDSKRINFANNKFRYCLTPQDDELLSSWLTRTALAHLTDPATFVNLYLPEWKNTLWTRDVDISADERLLETLAHKCQLCKEILYNLTLKSYQGYLAEEIMVRTSTPFIQPIVLHSRLTIGYGQRFCPLCLKAEKVRYFRKRWRFSFSTACIVHGCFLLDRCPECGIPVTLRRSYYYKNFPVCYKCGFDFAKSKPEFVDPDSYGLHAIKELYKVLESGIFSFGDRYAYSFLFFSVLRQFIKIAYNWGFDKGLLDHESMAQRIDLPVIKRKHIYVDDIPLKVQYLLFSGLIKIFENFPANFITFCERNELGKTELTRDLLYVPFFYKDIVDPFSMEYNPVTCDEIQSVIEHLERKRIAVCRERVCKTMGIFLRLDERKDVRDLFARNNVMVGVQTKPESEERPT